MTKKQKTILLAIVAIAGVLAIAVAGAGIWIVRSLVENVSMNQALQPGPSMMFRRVSAIPGRWSLFAMVRFSCVARLPFSLLRMRDGLFRLKAEPNASGLSFSTSLRVADIERYGPALLVDDHMPHGDRVLIWSD